MTTGKQLAGLLLLSTALTHPGAAFAQDAVEQQAAASAQSTDASVTADQAEPTEPPSDEPVAEQPDVSVPGGDVIFVTGRINRDPVALVDRLWPKFELDPEFEEKLRVST